MLSREDSYELVLVQIRELKNTRPELGSLLDCCAAILQAQRETRASFHPDFDGLDIDVCRARASDGAPLLRSGDIKIDWGLFDGLLDRIGQIILQRAETPNSLGSWLSMRRNRKEWADAFLKGLMEDRDLLDQAAERVGIRRNVLAFLACQTYAPFLEAYAEGLTETVDDSAWLRGYCPICGGDPLMGRLEKETGKRRLQCHLCRTEWTFKRLECPFCGNSDQQTLRFFCDQENPAYRVEVCDLCKRYLKTVDAREMENERSLFAVDLATLHLDLVAEREGFCRETNGRFGA